MHWKRWWRYGSPTKRLKAANGEGYTNGDGYRVVTVDGVPVYEHRHAMEKFLGRKLKPHEHVHHIEDENGIIDKSRNDPKYLRVYDSQREHMIHHDASRKRDKRGRYT